MKQRGQIVVTCAAAVIGIVGLVDAARQDSLALASLFTVVTLLNLALLLGFTRRAIEVRSDHHAWLARVATVTGEPIETVVDRAVGAYRDAHRD